MIQTDIITDLSPEESTWWEATIKEYRKKYLKAPKDYAKEIMDAKGFTKENITENLEYKMETTREEVWIRYLQDEAIFHKEVISHLIQNRKLPREILSGIIEKNIVSENFIKLSKEEALNQMAKVVGESAGRLMPYIYQLSLSTTNSRRSRAGKVFEKIIESFFDIFEYPYSNQSSFGNAAYNSKNLGKKVDLLVPNVESYLHNRPKCAVITMKTSLRERWQEVAEEISRTNVPHIYLLTVEEDVTQNKVTVMRQYNITLVLYNREKTKKFSDYQNVIDYETFFLREMPHIISYWKSND